MKPRKAAEIASALLNKGFRRSQSHHTFYILYAQGRKTSARTKISHSIREYGRSLLAQIARQLCLTASELDQFLECPLTEEDYVDRLIEQGHVRLDE